ncbi:sporulation protein YunB [Thalassobacillus cyri]|uniref:Sporulation protein YunB n=1 Tax=Thalassobacillus cyri TaxID=571932 RepID=A0A1H4GEK6_9BACI|nr:sporulation protein YunB [Thalassobacillus cyri]SEB07917.1 sporulation protein YunB [Thalassobacillus cyri]
MGKYAKNHGPPSMASIFIVTFIFFIFFTFLSLWIINRGITPTLIEIAETKTQQFGRDAILEAVSKRIADDLSFEDLVKMEKDESGNIVYMGWNSVVVNRVLRNTTFRVQNYLKQMERGEAPDPGTPLDVPLEEEEEETPEDKRQSPTLVEIPIGQATNNVLLANLGPRVPVQFEVIGYVQSNVENKITEYGINAAMFELTIHIEVDVRIVIPFSTRTTVVTADIPVDQSTIMGEVPDFYNGSGSQKSPSFSLPMDGFQVDPSP